MLSRSPCHPWARKGSADPDTHQPRHCHAAHSTSLRKPWRSQPPTTLAARSPRRKMTRRSEIRPNLVRPSHATPPKKGEASAPHQVSRTSPHRRQLGESAAVPQACHRAAGPRGSPASPPAWPSRASHPREGAGPAATYASHALPIGDGGGAGRGGGRGGGTRVFLGRSRERGGGRCSKSSAPSRTRVLTLQCSSCLHQITKSYIFL